MGKVMWPSSVSHVYILESLTHSTDLINHRLNNGFKFLYRRQLWDREPSSPKLYGPITTSRWNMLYRYHYNPATTAPFRSGSSPRYFSSTWANRVNTQLRVGFILFTRRFAERNRLSPRPHSPKCSHATRRLHYRGKPPPSQDYSATAFQVHLNNGAII